MFYTVFQLKKYLEDYINVFLQFLNNAVGEDGC